MKRLILLLTAAVTQACFVPEAKAQIPAITMQPDNEIVPPGGAATFSVAVEGPSPFSYLWQFNRTNLPTGVVTTIAGGGTNGLDDDGVATNAQLSLPNGVAVEAGGGFYIADNQNAIRRVGIDGIITTVAGNGIAGYAGDGGPATNALLSGPFGVALDAAGNLFVADMGNNRIRKVATNGIITTVAGTGSVGMTGGGFSGDGGAATNAELKQPTAMIVDRSGDLLIADSFNNRIRKVSTSGIITTMAGSGPALFPSGEFGGDGGLATNALLNGPNALAMDANGDLYISDSGNSRIRKVATNGIISTVAGNGLAFYSGDGQRATNVGFSLTGGISLDTSGNLFLADNDDTVYRVDSGGIITTVAGNGQQGFSGDGGPAVNAEFHWLNSVTVDSAENLLISDAGNNRIRKVALGGPRLVLSNVNAINVGAYDVVVSNAYGSVTSSVVNLVVALNPLSALKTEGHGMELHFQGVAGNAYILMAATNLTPPIDWVPIVTNVADINGNWTITVANLISNGSFYRISTLER